MHAALPRDGVAGHLDHDDDFLSNPLLDDYDLSSPQGIRGGGAAMPQAICARLKEKTRLDYVEGYGMSETMAAYKSPRIVEFVPRLPKSGSGKVQWRELQEQEAARTAP